MMINDTARRTSEACEFDDDTGISGHLARGHGKLGIAHGFYQRDLTDHYYTQLAEAAMMVMVLSYRYGLYLEKAVGKHLYGETPRRGRTGPYPGRASELRRGVEGPLGGHPRRDDVGRASGAGPRRRPDRETHTES